MFTIEAFLQNHRLLANNAQVQISKLKGGYWNEVFRVQSEQFDWVLKRFHKEDARARLYPVLPDSEALALRTLTGTGVAPHFVRYFPETHSEQAVLIYEFASGDTWQGNINAVAELMKRYHALNLQENTFRTLAVSPKGILEQADALLASCKSNALSSRLIALRPHLQSVPPLAKRSLVHTDAWIGNFIGNENHLVLIDWQCPGMGDPAEDVWTFLYSGYEQLMGLAVYTETQRRQFLETYNDNTMLERLRLLSPFFAYRVAAHCVSRIQDLELSNSEASKLYSLLLNQLIDTLKHAR